MLGFVVVVVRWWVVVLRGVGYVAVVVVVFAGLCVCWCGVLWVRFLRYGLCVLDI